MRKESCYCSKNYKGEYSERSCTHVDINITEIHSIKDYRVYKRETKRGFFNEEPDTKVIRNTCT
ncbi:hypothetical protein PIROE2DRAFT_7570 [Piromyces sp. E2]|nr:hypothetical protein PIROE2DRAFT_7570 [Piromyces sp. E2]|eukprot:OUM65454.1 hypothetical protein PIROE2DRAFT_7570 [Piromyces sp. E2]